jgi:DNA-binding CsgD family transcriptional regulator
MLQVFRVAEVDDSPPLHDIADMIAAIGRDEFASTTLQCLNEAIGIDHLAVCRFGANGAIDFHDATSVGGPRHSENAARQYFGHFSQLDPIRRISRAGPRDGAALLVCNRAADIADQRYRQQCYAEPEIAERLALYAPLGPRLFQINVYRSASRAGFTEADAAVLARFATVLLPCVGRHAEMASGRDAGGVRLPLALLRQRVELLEAGLSEREREVCARALYGQSIEGTALELDISFTSVATYRRRAYAKLNISCCNELFALAFRQE